MSGTSTGHALPGLAFAFLSLWWTFKMYRNYFKCKENNSTYNSMTWFPSGKNSNRPTEIICKLVIISLAIIRQIFAFFSPSNQHPDTTAIHTTMGFFFVLQALVELLQFYKVSSLPPRAEYLTLSMAYFIEGILFCFHNSHGKSPYETLLHTLLIISITGSFMSTVLEAHFNQNITLSITRAFFLLLQGTWFLHIACIIYAATHSLVEVYDGSKVTSHGQMMFTVVYFTWHVAIDLIVVFLIGILVGWRSRRMKSCIVDCNFKCNGENEFLVLSGDLSN